MKLPKRTLQRTRRDSKGKAAKAQSPPSKSKRLGAVARASARYYEKSGRVFPWRAERNPYRLAIAEILLQKTRAKSVIAIYRSVIHDYFRPALLARANIDDLELRLHALGLSRKRALQLVAMGATVSRSGDRVFDDWKALLTNVPGIGAYAARAIACFGRGERIGIVDANTSRILRRIFAIEASDARAVVFQHYADAIASSAKDVRATNFGLLDIGAVICLKNPRCAACPLASFCKYALRRSAATPGSKNATQNRSTRGRAP